ncbi:MarR family transcriptional regulator, partial [Lysinibacillus sp. OL1_EC]|nr:MarR family transcriptional regulator [Lysinibacillus sp. OL1_EC]
MGKNVIDFGQAERNARKRDFENEKLEYAQKHDGLSQEEIENAMATLSRATGKEVFLGTKRSPQSKVRFAQHLQENLGYLYQHNYL